MALSTGSITLDVDDCPISVASESVKLSEEDSKKIDEVYAILKDEEDPEQLLKDPMNLDRFLRACKGDVEKAAAKLKATLKWRREKKPGEWDCRWCIETPGYHSWRQIGFSREGCPIVYSCYIQTGHLTYSSEDAVRHLVYAIENAIRTMKNGVEKWMWVCDFSGFGVAGCNPAIASSASHVLANYYPERLSQLMFVNPPAIFVMLWKAIQNVIDPVTAAKVVMVRGGEVDAAISAACGEEEARWLLEEIRLNKLRPLPTTQGPNGYWKPPPPSSDPQQQQHDPRGCASFLSRYCSPEQLRGGNFVDGHVPHPNILVDLRMGGEEGGGGGGEGGEK